jgi:Flp pilus assembly protein TadD
MADFDHATRLRPDDPQLFEDLAQCAVLEGDDATAISAFQHMLILSPRDPSPLQIIAWLYVTGNPDVRRSPEEALPLALKSFQLDPSSLTARIIVGAVRYRLGHYDEAVRIFQAEAREQHPYRPYNDLLLAMALHRLGRGKAAREAFEGALKHPRPDQRRSRPDLERNFQQLRAEAEAVLASPTDALPADVFVRPR